MAAAAIAARRRQEQIEEQRQKESTARRIAMMQTKSTGGFRYGIMIYSRGLHPYDVIYTSSPSFDEIIEDITCLLIEWIKRERKISNLLIFGTDKDPDLMNWDILYSLPRDKTYIQRVIVEGDLVCVFKKGSALLMDMSQIASLDSKQLTKQYKSKGGTWSFLESDNSKRMFLLRDLVKNLRRAN